MAGTKTVYNSVNEKSTHYIYFEVNFILICIDIIRYTLIAKRGMLRQPNYFILSGKMWVENAGMDSLLKWGF